MRNIEIDQFSGFCFGVVNAIRKAEDKLQESDSFYCLGDIVHNTIEVERLRQKGLKTLTHEEMTTLRNTSVLFRAHGEPPSTYEIAQQNDIEVIDATCPVVLNLQKRIKRIYEERKGTQTQLLIFGKLGHAEVNGLVGQTNNTAIVIERKEDLEKLDFSLPIVMFSQTTKSKAAYMELVEMIQERIEKPELFEFHNTICQQFGNRMPKIKEFAASHDCIVFVSDAKSSNGKALFKACQEVNPDSHFVSGPQDVDAAWIEGKNNIGICGATSTPAWLMEQVKDRIAAL
ncbi:MAG: 4-hydroxy-3-methylbut-2-enyl diphosphate reductase [Bacteroidales bacterium]|nr:4-hydroxy-3-methylbut-2-enyl diphosphate reductase [Bacteroidales bacterium]